ncbi:type IV pilin protein [Undibacterium cyanobacteriorum]|uniref:Type IV pilin protein n=1 Tax=Undibacterium cyanobacteriorum TaxID=3073561 RepID=A0ABY9RFY5_9BURK|nr:type IV pilin protein [Undibacterium sp. 20NA77.5]WMW79774.1 type IV pilin protein [Undibacterium sp. 20NA77.5]
MSVCGRSKMQGFTLIEMMITILVISIITAIAYPSYRDNVRRGDRAEARAALMENAQFMERVFTENNAYDKASSASLPRTVSPANSTGTSVKYQFTLSNVTSTSFTLQAEPKNSQSSDACGKLTVNNLGQKSVNGTPTGGMTADTCWQK